MKKITQASFEKQLLQGKREFKGVNIPVLKLTKSKLKYYFQFTAKGDFEKMQKKLYGKVSDLVMNNSKIKLKGKKVQVNMKAKNADFSGSNLPNSSIAYTDMEGTIFDNSNLVKGYFGRSKMNRSSFKKCDMRESSFEKGDWTNVNFEGANLEKSTFDRLYFEKANMNKANFSNCFGSFSFNNSTARETNFENSGFDGSFSRVDFTKANLKNAGFGSSISLDSHYPFMESCKFDSADLTSINLKSANLQKSSFKNANLKKANLSFTDLEGADFKGADLAGASFDGSILRNVKNLDKAKNLNRASFRNVDFSKDVREILFNATTNAVYAKVRRHRFGQEKWPAVVGWIIAILYAIFYVIMLIPRLIYRLFTGKSRKSF